MPSKTIQKHTNSQSSLLLNKIILITIIFISLFSCKKENEGLIIKQVGVYSYDVLSENNDILFSFMYDKNHSKIPARIIIPNEDINNSILIFFEIDINGNINRYQVSDGKYFEDLVVIFPEEDILVEHVTQINKNNIFYTIDKDGKIEINYFVEDENE